MNKSLYELTKEDLLESIKLIKDTESTINTQLTDALEMYSQVKGKKVTELAKKYLEDTNQEIINSDGFLIFYELCVHGPLKIEDKEMEILIQGEIKKRDKKNKKSWEQILENYPSPFVKNLLLKQAFIDSHSKDYISLKVSRKWFKFVESKSDLINHLINKHFAKNIGLSIEIPNVDKNLEMSYLFENAELNSLLKPWRGLFREKTEYFLLSLPWTDDTKRGDIITSRNFFAEEFYFDEDNDEFITNRERMMIRNAKSKKTKHKFLNFEARKVLKNINKHPKNNLVLKAFFQLQIAKTLGIDYVSEELDSVNSGEVSFDFEEKVTSQLKKVFKKAYDEFQREMPINLDYRDNLWLELEKAAESLRESIVKFRLNAESKIASYLGDEKKLLFENIFLFLNKNDENPIAIPTIEKLGEYDGGYYLVKKISQNFGGLKNLREPYSKWVVQRLEREQEDLNTERDILEDDFSSRWKEMFEELKKFDQFKAKNDSPITLRSYSPQLATWLNRQRLNYKKGLLTKEQGNIVAKYLKTNYGGLTIRRLLED
tara:strand:+ start:4451 stop:6082 length:1632 start_codon:yes stop_codon:yes gene_type:complete